MNPNEKKDRVELGEQDLEHISGGAESNGLQPCFCPSCKRTMAGMIGATCPYCKKSKLFPA